MNRDPTKILLRQYEQRRRAELEHQLAKIRIYYTLFYVLLLFAAREYLYISLPVLLLFILAVNIYSFTRYFKPTRVSEERNSPPAIDYLDLLFIAVFIYLTGGVKSFFLIAYIVAICGGIIRFGLMAGVWGYLFALSTTGLMYFLNIASPVLPIGFHIIAGTVTLAFVAWMVGILAEKEWQLRDEIYLVSISDHLTGLHNFNYMQARIKEEIERCSREDTGFALSFIDLDDFKLINDQYGHLVGDKILKQVAEILAGNIRKSDVLARYGGDEFILFMPATGAAAVQRVMQRVEKAITTAAYVNGVKVGFCSGMAVFPEDGSNLEQLLIAADKRMYAKKDAKLASS